MRFDIVVTGGTVVNSAGQTRTDVGIIGERIVTLGDLATEDAEMKLDATGLHILPGIIDTQVHFREPGLEYKEDLESGSRAAVMGGVTSYFEMPNTNPATTTQTRLSDKLARAGGRSWSNFSFFVGASPENIEELRTLEQSPGTPGVKIFMGSSTGALLIEDDELLRGVLDNGVRRCPVHAEDEPMLRMLKEEYLASAMPNVRDHPRVRHHDAARLATERLIKLCRETGRPVHILHVSTMDELPLIAAAKREGLPVTAEVTPQHLWFAAPDCYDRLGTKAQMNPPIRSEEHRSAIREAFIAGLFDVFGSDHAPHTIEEKALPYPSSPSGMPGVQTLLPAILTLCLKQGLGNIEKVVAMGAEHPAKLYGIKDRGRIATGFFADLTIVDLKQSSVVESCWLQSKCGWSPFEGEELLGKPVHVLVNGAISVRDGELHGTPCGRAVEFDWK